MTRLTLKKYKQQGFTLVELAVVGIFLGLLAVFAISAFNGSATSSTRAKALAEASSKVSANWGLVIQYCRIPSDISATAVSSLSLGNVSRANLSYLLGSDSSLNTNYISCINQAGIRQLLGVSTGAAGSEKVQEYPIGSVATLNIAGRSYLAITYSNVPDNVVLSAYNQLSSASGASTATALPVSDSADQQLRFSTVTAGVRSLTFINPI